jgi:arsenate reductase
MTTKLYKDLQDTITALDISIIPEARKPILQQVIDYIRQQTATGQRINLNFICTHNSRRSHLSQLWAQAMAAAMGVNHVNCYSGGTEATALFPKVAETLATQGFEMSKISEGENPVYAIKYAEEAPPVIGFSKTYDHPFNPASHFAAVMTCSHADENCPVILGCDSRIALTYDDPKAFDNTPLQTEKYEERSLQIATEMKYIFSNCK